MKNEKMLHAIGQIDDELIYGAVNDVMAGQTKKNGWRKWAAMAACLCLVMAGIFAVPNLNEGTHDYIETVTYNGAVYAVCGSGEAAILEKCGLPTSLSEALAGNYLGELQREAESEYNYVIGDTQAGSMKIYEYAPAPNENVYILCIDGEYYAAIRKDADGYHGLPTPTGDDEYRYPIKFIPNTP